MSEERKTRRFLWWTWERVPVLMPSGLQSIGLRGPLWEWRRVRPRPTNSKGTRTPKQDAELLAKRFGHIYDEENRNA